MADRTGRAERQIKRLQGPGFNATLWLAVAVGVVIYAGGGPGAAGKGYDMPLPSISCARRTAVRGRQALAQPPLISVG